jgi:hypothetical protein
MIKKGIAVIFVFSIILSSSCKKGPGEGGRATIKGKIWVRKHDPATYDVVDNYAGADDDVYIIYGDETTYGGHQKTDYQGDFEFNYLRKGNYKIYVYSDDSAKIVGPPVNTLAPKAVIVKDITISDKKQVEDVGIITVLH